MVRQVRKSRTEIPIHMLELRDLDIKCRELQGFLRSGHIGLTCNPNFLYFYDLRFVVRWFSAATYQLGLSWGFRV